MKPGRYYPHVTVIVVCLCFAAWLDHEAVARRKVPILLDEGEPAIYTVATQLDAFALYKTLGLHGAAVVHCSPYLNLVEYFPPEEERTAPFPIRTADIRPAYEKGLNAHTWLFIANRIGLVRTATVVLPDDVFRERLGEFRANMFFSAEGVGMSGHARDMPFKVFQLGDLPSIAEPVVVNVDAGFFRSGMDPAALADRLRLKLPDLRVLVLIGSTNESAVTSAMREDLLKFAAAYQTIDATGGKGRP